MNEKFLIECRTCGMICPTFTLEFANALRSAHHSANLSHFIEVTPRPEVLA